jgi:hypothetical protein
MPKSVNYNFLTASMRAGCAQISAPIAAAFSNNDTSAALATQKHKNVLGLISKVANKHNRLESFLLSSTSAPSPDALHSQHFQSLQNPRLPSPSQELLR